MADTKENYELSPLDQIRQVEAEVTRRIAVAHEAAERSIANARVEVTQLINQADEAGQRKGQANYQQTIKQAEENATALTVQAQNRAEDLQCKGYQRMDLAINRAVKFILGQEGEAG